MKIANNYQISSKPNFGMSVVATEDALRYMNSKLNPKQAEEANLMIAEQRGKKPNIHFHLGSFERPSNGRRMNYLRAKVGNEVFKEGLFTSAFGVIKKSIAYALSIQNKVARR